MEELPRIYSGEGILSAREITRTGLPLHCRSPSDFAGYVGEAEAFPKAFAALRTSDRRLEELASLERNSERRRVGFSAVRRNMDGTRLCRAARQSAEARQVDDSSSRKLGFAITSALPTARPEWSDPLCAGERTMWRGGLSQT